jgi:hypothetical protein
VIDLIGIEFEVQIVWIGWLEMPFYLKVWTFDIIHLNFRRW